MSLGDGFLSWCALVYEDVCRSSGHERYSRCSAADEIIAIADVLFGLTFLDTFSLVLHLPNPINDIAGMLTKDCQIGFSASGTIKVGGNRRHGAACSAFPHTLG